MNIKKPAIAILILALLGAFALWWFSPAQVLKRRTRTFLQTLTLESGSGRAGRQLGVYSLTALLAPDVELESDSIQEANGKFERAELESAYSSLCEHAKQTRFNLERFNRVEVAGDQADMDLTLQALVELPAYRPVDGRYEAKFHWLRAKDGWQLSRASWVEARK